MKAKYILVSILIVALTFFGMGCVNIDAKVTGGGKFTDSGTGQKITFGLNAQASEDGTFKGQFQLIDHSTKPLTRVHGTFEGVIFVGVWGGECTINGEGPYDFAASFIDVGEPGANPGDGDVINIWIDDPNETFYSGNLEGGNIQVHPAKPDKGG